MTQEEKDLLLRDLSSRLPYEVKVQFSYIITSPAILKGINKDLIECDIAVCELEDVKPYLLPLSSMTPKQKAELSMLVIGVEDIFKSFLIEVEFYHKHHIDYRGLIPMGLAIDATGLNIY